MAKQGLKAEHGFSVMILAAGKATRFKSEHSKMLHKLAGRLLGEYILRTAAAIVPQRIYMVIGHEAETLRKIFMRANLHFIEQAEQRGTGHALIVSRKVIEACPSEHLLVLVGDAPLLRAETLRELVAAHTKSGAAATVLSTRVDNPHGYGRVIRTGPAKGNRVRAIVEEKVATPAQRKVQEINSGIICFSRAQLVKHLSELSDDNAQKEYLLTDMIEIFNKHGQRVMAFEVADSREVLGVNDRVELAQMERILRRRKAEALAREGVTVVDPDATYIDDDVTVGRDTVIEPGVSLLGATKVGSACTIRLHSTITDSVVGDRVMVRPNCVITGSEVGADVILGPFAHLRDGAAIEQDARIGNFVEVKKSRVGRGSKAWHLTYLGDATLGVKVNIGAGTVTCNYDGEKKNHTVIDDGSFIGSGSMLVAPVNVGKGAYVAAGSTITQNVPAESLALGRAPQVNKEGWVKARKQAKLAATSDVRYAGTVAIIDVSGRVTLGESSKALGQRIKQAMEAGSKRVLVNMAQVSYIDSSGLGELVGAFSRIQKVGGLFKLAGVTKEVSYLFHVANFDRLLDMHLDEASALESFNKTPAKEADKA
ncbi:MAG TPA: bifunctional UDP-N-acetylglucosamine diphosphorylase/glucosamine-1-phosphate N-acetyltransferase GlmU [Terriglobia bacterium]|nr:bifunctional UDP-N-acetylglucosamine diphosphorylase/glucosamine-1-phosphate N-acetyltransferase GlmU [Terriglobia bacterium]